MNLAVVGVLEDGSNLRQGVPANPRTALRITLGDNVELTLTVVRPNGAYVDLTGATLTWTIKQNPAYQQYVVQAVAAQVGADALNLKRGVAIFRIGQSDYRKTQVQPGRYGYDVVMVDSDGNRNAVVPLSPIFVEPTNLKV